MTPFEKTTPTLISSAKAREDLMAQSNEWWTVWLECKPEEVTKALKEAALDLVINDTEFYTNDVYTVHVRNLGMGDNGELVHLSIKRHDRAPVSDWRDKQSIKNFFCGEESEGIELYPAESRVVDSSNQYHLWVFKGGKIPMGFPKGYKSESIVGHSKQRPFDQPNTCPKCGVKIDKADYHQCGVIKEGIIGTDLQPPTT